MFTYNLSLGENLWIAVYYTIIVQFWVTFWRGRSFPVASKDMSSQYFIKLLGLVVSLWIWLLSDRFICQYNWLNISCIVSVIQVAKISFISLELTNQLLIKTICYSSSYTYTIANLTVKLSHIHNAGLSSSVLHQYILQNVLYT